MLYNMMLPVIISAFIFAAAFLVNKIISGSMNRRVEKRIKELEELSSEKNLTQNTYISDNYELHTKIKHRLSQRYRIIKLLFIIDVFIFALSWLAFICFQEYNIFSTNMIYSVYKASAMIIAIVGFGLVCNYSKITAPKKHKP